MNIISIMRILLIIFGIASTLYILKDVYAHKEELGGSGKDFLILGVVGFVTNFFDTWGIGSYAPTQAAFKFTKKSPDDTVPGTLNVGDTLPVTIEAILFLGFVEIDPLTLILMIAAAMAGAYIGAGMVSKWDIRVIRIVLGIALLVVAVITVCKTMGVGPFGTSGTLLGLAGIKLILGVICNFFLGAFMMVGCGLYAPCTALCAMLGLNIAVAFPIMMGSCAFLMNTSVFKFVKEGKYDRRATLMLMFPGSLGAIAAYLLAAYAFSLTTLTYVVCVVMVITASMYFKDAKKTV